MKTITATILFILCAASSTLAISVGLLPVFGPVNFNLTVYSQDANFANAGSKVKQTATSTNTTMIYKSTVTNVTVSNPEIVALLANSFQTNFPTGARLFVDGTGFYVVAADGTTVLLNVSSVISLHLHPYSVHTGVEVVVNTLDTTGGHSRVQDRENSLEVYDINYDDGALTTGDSSHTVFQFSGLVRVKTTISAKTGAIMTSFDMNGQGSGYIRNHGGTFTGQVNGSGTLLTPI